MTREKVLKALAQRAESLRARGAEAAYLFGSVARDEAKPGSDIDLFIDVAPDRQFSLLDLVGIELFLARELGEPVDIAMREGLHPKFRAAIEREAVRAF